MSKLNVIIYRTENGLSTFERKEIESDLDEFYKEIDCERIDIVTKEVNGHKYTIICDDEGILTGKNLNLFLDNSVIAGDVIFTKYNGKSYLEGFTQEEADECVKDIYKSQFEYDE